MKKSILTTILLFNFVALKAQLEEPVKWSYVSKRTANNEAILYIKATIQAGWHIYSAYQPDGGPVKTVFSFPVSKSYGLIGEILEPMPIVKHEKIFSMDVKYFEKSVVFQQKIKLKTKHTVVKGKVEFMACTNKQCLPPGQVEFSIPIK